MDRSQKTRFNKIRKIALSGDFEKAISGFEEIKAEGVWAVTASLAEIYGFLFNWGYCLENAGIFIAHPNAAYAGNVFDNMCRVLYRAGEETRNWERIRFLCQDAVMQINTEPYLPFQKNRYIKILENLKSLAENGRPDRPERPELIEIFTANTENTDLDGSNKKATYVKALDNLNSISYKGNPNEKVRKRVALAIAYKQLDEAEEVFLKNEDLPIWDFQLLLPLIKRLVRKGEEEVAWRVVKNNITNWIPEDIVQIAPVDFIIDDDLKTFMTADRCLEVLKTSRSAGKDK
jgi:hypothetical protein